MSGRGKTLTQQQKLPALSGTRQQNIKESETDGQQQHDGHCIP